MVKIIGGGLAGVEVAYFLAKNGIKVRLYEMRPSKKTPVHETGALAELVCSNSLRSDSMLNAVGILKREMELFDSLIIKAARHSSVSAGSSLAVDRTLFQQYINNVISNHENIEVIREEVTKINPSELTIIAAGPLASDDLFKEISQFFPESDLHFYDAVAPIIMFDSINKDIAYLKNRYDLGEPAYLNCPMDKLEYEKFYQELIRAESVILKDFEKNVFEGCLPIEVMAKRGKETLLFGPLKPVGLNQNGKKHHAVVQLRQDDMNAKMYNLVGFQTNLTFKAQLKLLKLIPGLKNVEIVRYGVMHRNTYLESPKHLNSFYQSKVHPLVFFAGQISGVEGYVESAASGITAAFNVRQIVLNQPLLSLPKNTMMGSLANYISISNNSFVPMNINFGIIPSLEQTHKKQERKKLYGERAIEEMIDFVKEHL